MRGGSGWACARLVLLVAARHLHAAQQLSYRQRRLLQSTAGTANGTTSTWSVQSGPCTTSFGGLCVGRVAGFTSDETCAIVAGDTVVLAVTKFSVGQRRDLTNNGVATGNLLQIGHDTYSGTNGPAWKVVRKGSHIMWKATTAASTTSGWEVCTFSHQFCASAIAEVKRQLWQCATTTGAQGSCSSACAKAWESALPSLLQTNRALLAQPRAFQDGVCRNYWSCD